MEPERAAFILFSVLGFDAEKAETTHRVKFNPDILRTLSALRDSTVKAYDILFHFLLRKLYPERVDQLCIGGAGFFVTADAKARAAFRNLIVELCTKFAEERKLQPSAFRVTKATLTSPKPHHICSILIQLAQHVLVKTTRREFPAGLTLPTVQLLAEGSRDAKALQKNALQLHLASISSRFEEAQRRQAQRQHEWSEYAKEMATDYAALKQEQAHLRSRLQADSSKGASAGFNERILQNIEQLKAMWADVERSLSTMGIDSLTTPSPSSDSSPERTDGDDGIQPGANAGRPSAGVPFLESVMRSKGGPVRAIDGRVLTENYVAGLSTGSPLLPKELENEMETEMEGVDWRVGGDLPSSTPRVQSAPVVSDLVSMLRVFNSSLREVRQTAMGWRMGLADRGIEAVPFVESEVDALQEKAQALAEQKIGIVQLNERIGRLLDHENTLKEAGKQHVIKPAASLSLSEYLRPLSRPLMKMSDLALLPPTPQRPVIISADSQPRFPPSMLPISSILQDLLSCPPSDPVASAVKRQLLANKDAALPPTTAAPPRSQLPSYIPIYKSTKPALASAPAHAQDPLPSSAYATMAGRPSSSFAKDKDISTQQQQHSNATLLPTKSNSAKPSASTEPHVASASSSVLSNPPQASVGTTSTSAPPPTSQQHQSCPQHAMNPNPPSSLSVPPPSPPPPLLATSQHQPFIVVPDDETPSHPHPPAAATSSTLSTLPIPKSQHHLPHQPSPVTAMPAPPPQQPHPLVLPGYDDDDDDPVPAMMPHSDPPASISAPPSLATYPIPASSHPSGLASTSTTTMSAFLPPHPALDPVLATPVRVLKFSSAPTPDTPNLLTDAQSSDELTWLASSSEGLL